jgi:hypothetical protein
MKKQKQTVNLENKSGHIVEPGGSPSRELQDKIFPSYQDLIQRQVRIDRELIAEMYTARQKYNELADLLCQFAEKMGIDNSRNMTVNQLGNEVTKAVDKRLLSLLDTAYQTPVDNDEATHP